MARSFAEWVKKKQSEDGDSVNDKTVFWLHIDHLVRLYRGKYALDDIWSYAREECNITVPYRWFCRTLRKTALETQEVKSSVRAKEREASVDMAGGDLDDSEIV